jgi:hypothetical protein
MEVFMKSVIKYFLVFLLFFSVSLSTKIRNIYESGGAQSIQDSIDISEVFDTIMVHNGKYYIGDLSGPLGLNLKGRQIMSVSPDSAPYCILTAISSSGLDTAYHVIWDTLGPVMGYFSLIQGFTIINGKSSTWYENRGGGIHAYGCSLLIIQDNIITKNIGSGIALIYANALIQRNIISNNEDGGIYIFGDSVVIKDNVISNNSNYGGGGIYYYSGIAKDKEKLESNSQIENNLIIGNYAEYGGGIASVHFVSPYLKGNIIAFNKAILGGAISICGYRGSNIDGEDNIIIANVADTGGVFDIYECDYHGSLINSFIVDNGSLDEKSGLIFQNDQFYSSPFNLSYSNIYYNTYQKDIEVYIKSSLDTSLLQHNFWWLTDSAKIDSLIDGPADFIPFMMGPVPDTPGEPVEIFSVLNYSSDYSSIVDSIGGDPDTLFLEITGHDNKHEFQEAAVAILKSRIYSTGVAVALLETDKSTGIYRGKAIVKTTNPPDSIRIDDIYQIIRVHPDADTIRVYANMDTTEMFKVYYRCQSGVEEDSLNKFILEPVQNLTSLNPEFRFHIPEGCEVELSIYDICGRLVEEVLSKRISSGWHTVQVKIEKAGIYVYQIKNAFGEISGKLVVVR